MSALPPKADIGIGRSNSVSFATLAAILLTFAVTLAI
jgi:hypothetical protein